MTLGDKSEEINATLKEIVSDEYMHIGQLEKIIQSIKPEAINLEVEVK
jgi:rubrerythrin